MSLYPGSYCYFHKISCYRSYGNISIKFENYEIQYKKELTVNEHEKIHIRFIKYLRKSTLSAIKVRHMNVHLFQAEVIQGVTGGTDQTSGECSLGHTTPI